MTFGFDGDGNKPTCESDMATNVDLASTQLALKQKQDEIDNIRLDADFDGKRCVECDHPIDPKRITALRRVYNKEKDPKGLKLKHTFVEDKITYIHGTDKCAGCATEVARLQEHRKKLYA